jgi:hypothetical protein
MPVYTGIAFFDAGDIGRQDSWVTFRTKVVDFVEQTGPALCARTRVERDLLIDLEMMVNRPSLA